LRSFLDAILAFIGSTSLTDLEFEDIDISDLSVNVYNQELYDVLAQVLVDRDAISTTKDRLTYFFKSKGIAVDETTVTQAKSNIFIGAVLE